MIKINIEKLPENISNIQAIEQCYPEAIRFVCSRLMEGISVLVTCEKQIIPFLQSVIRKRLSSEGLKLSIIDGRSTGEVKVARIQTMVNQITDLINNTSDKTVFVIPYLDIITSGSNNNLSFEGKEVITIIHENPDLILLAFEDPDFPIPKIIAQAFPAKTSMIGIERNRLAFLITKNEAKKFAQEELNIMQLYRYVSGLNPVKLRKLMNIFSNKTNFQTGNEEILLEYYKELRDYTKQSDTLSPVSLEKDIAGYKEVKNKISENILDLLEKSYSSGDETFVKHIEEIIPRGIILYGPPGTGKTLFAKGIAGVVNATIYLVNGPELKSKWVGEGEANIRRLFARARSTAPSMIIFDEFDSLASARSTEANDGAINSSNSIVNQLLTEMDGFRKEELVIVVGTTNFPESLDSALLRPGRFEYKIEIPYPIYEDKFDILDLYNKKYETNLSKEQLELLANYTERLTDTGTPYSGDHLNALIRALKRNLLTTQKNSLDHYELLLWLKKQNKINILTPEEEKVVAFHEIGHTLMYKKYGKLKDVKKVTIESGITNVLGMVEINIKKNQNFFTQQEFKSMIAMALGGYVAEKIFFGEVSTGSLNDLKNATRIAEDMVVFYGMGNLEVPRYYADSSGDANPYFNNIISPQVDALLLEIKEGVHQYINKNKDLLEKTALLLLEKRTFEKQDIITILGE